VNIRKFVLTANSPDALVALGTLTAQVAQFLEAAVVAGLNVIVGGGTQAGETTLLNCLAAAIPARERASSSPARRRSSWSTRGCLAR
jgi:pilus assembly protein CpaF